MPAAAPGVGGAENLAGALLLPASDAGRYITGSSGLADSGLRLT
ncbi:MAG: hypothetical protein ACR2QJ_04960 [Geminicoccaceae bacterium]